MLKKFLTTAFSLRLHRDWRIVIVSTNGVYQRFPIEREFFHLAIVMINIFFEREK
jgi:hypothetical protein